MHFKHFILATILIPSIAYPMEKDPKSQDLSHLILKGVSTEKNVHTIADLGTNIDFRKRERTVGNWINRVQKGKSPLFGATPLFEYHYNKKNLIPIGTIDTISFTEMESLNNGSWLYVANLRKYYLNNKTYVRMGAFLRIVDTKDLRFKKGVFFDSSNTHYSLLDINKTALLQQYYKKHALPQSYSQKKQVVKCNKTRRKRTSDATAPAVPENSPCIPMRVPDKDLKTPNRLPSTRILLTDPLLGYFCIPESPQRIVGMVEMDSFFLNTRLD